MSAQIDPDKTIDNFPVQICLWTLGQHCTGNFLFIYLFIYLLSCVDEIYFMINLVIPT